MFADRLLADKVILVTGGGSGLGKAMARRFGELGARLALVGRREAVLQETQQEFAQAGIETWIKPLDVRQPDRVAETLDAVWAHYGRLDVLVNNAAGNFLSPFERLSSRAVDAVVNIVLHGTLYCTLEAGKRWIARKRPGTVLNIVATYAWTGSGFVVPSAVAKAGVLAATRSLAVEWAPYGIRHVAIAPGPFPTEGAWSRLAPTPESAQVLEGRVPVGRVGRPEELANLAAYLVSDYAAFINGEVVTIDGGAWMSEVGFNPLRRLSAEDWDRIRELTRRPASGEVSRP